jgi:hypothetical protein
MGRREPQELVKADNDHDHQYVRALRSAYACDGPCSDGFAIDDATSLGACRRRTQPQALSYVDPDVLLLSCAHSPRNTAWHAAADQR